MTTVAHLQSIRIFSELSNKELKDLSKLMTELDIPEGRDLTREGEVGREFLVIRSGKAVVRRKGRKIAELGPGDFLGELAVLSGAPRTATVTTLTPCVVETLNRREFMSMLDRSPRVAKKILLGAVARLHELEATKTL